MTEIVSAESNHNRRVSLKNWGRGIREKDTTEVLGYTASVPVASETKKTTFLLVPGRKGKIQTSVPNVRLDRGT